eukprot:CAMPEP_0119040446 /NCGR_PEP_ID=MMETSP1177-20130426/10368_1 /TAXON_ID=2985 /ORGANISM="Ochromonas sp, Strain CCMP1899" /LENGTH=155 /DNA_ID=CAMNT_0007005491 /DNA_START=498 /DNA_END=962 /DNA_ORIENTATION=+
MIVAVDSEVKNVIVGFLEIGLLPNPAGINPTIEVVDPNFNPTLEEGAAIDGIEVSSNMNVENYDENKIEISDNIDNSSNTNIDSPESFINENENEKMRSENENENEVSEGIDVDPNMGNLLVLEAAKLEAEQRRAKRREEVPYLGNVAVNNNYRR